MMRRFAKYKGRVVRHISSDEGERRLLLGTTEPSTATELAFGYRDNGEFTKWVFHKDIEYRWEEHFFALYQNHRFEIIRERENQYCLWTNDFGVGKACGFSQTDKYDMEKWVPKTDVDGVIRETRMFIWNGHKWERA